MFRRRFSGSLPVLAFGIVAFAIACLSILDMFLPHPYDGVVLDVDRTGLVVRSVVPASGAARGGIDAGDRIAGIGRVIVRSKGDAARALAAYELGARVPYLVERDGKLLEKQVELGRRRLGTPLYVYACISGFLFFFLGLFVLLSRPSQRPGTPSQVFFTLCTLFLLLLVCRLREPSYSSFDWVVLTTGTLSLLVLPAAFLHFFLVFPRRLRVSFREGDAPTGGTSLLVGLEHFLNDSPNLVRLLYLVPPLFYVSSLALAALFDVQIRLVFLAPISSWVLMGDYFVLGLLALLASMLKSQEGRERRQIGWVFAGTVLGVTPFLLFAVVLPSVWGTDQFVAWGVIPLALVPLTFAYAVVRFQFFDIKVIVRRSLLYTVTTAIVSGAYALGIAAVNLIFRDSLTGRSPLFFLIMALAIVALFDPLRRRLQGPVDRFFFRDAYDARLAIEEVSAALVREFSFAGLERLLVERLEAIMHLEWAVLYRHDVSTFVSQSALSPLPAVIASDLAVWDELARLGEPVRPGVLEPIRALDPASRTVLDQFAAAETRLLVPLASRDRLHALLALGPKRSEEDYGRDDLQLIRTLANQGAVAFETATLLRDRTRQLELEKELEIARRVQFSLIPERLQQAPGWRLAARCVPARQVGGDFYDALPCDDGSAGAYVLGDVSGKSVPGAMLMVAAREILHTAALRGATPGELLEVANQRLYAPSHRLFVALVIMLLDGNGVSYVLAGQPAPLLRRCDGLVEEAPATEHRLPVGALKAATWDLRHIEVAPGDTVVLYSDGLTDARSPAGEFFGDERLRNALARLDGPPEAILDGLLAEIEGFVAGGEAWDDVTILIAQRERE